MLHEIRPAASRSSQADLKVASSNGSITECRPNVNGIWIDWRGGEWKVWKRCGCGFWTFAGGQDLVAVVRHTTRAGWTCPKCQHVNEIAWRGFNRLEIPND